MKNYNVYAGIQTISDDYFPRTKSWVVGRDAETIGNQILHWQPVLPFHEKVLESFDNSLLKDDLSFLTVYITMDYGGIEATCYLNGKKLKSYETIIQKLGWPEHIPYQLNQTYFFKKK